MVDRGREGLITMRELGLVAMLATSTFAITSETR